MSDAESPSSGSQPGSFTPPSVEALDAVLDSYELIEILGRGGMGAVYKARQTSLDRVTAIKVLPDFEDSDGYHFAERFQREAKAMGRLTHPNIISVYDFGSTKDGLLYIVMEFVDGVDLNELLKAGGVTTEHLYSWIPQICDALQYAHSQGIIHRDIKPANVMITREGVVKIADFGLAKLTTHDEQSTRLTMTNVAMGTPDYVAPEALEEGVEADHRADIYAVGVMLYEMLTGKVPRGAWHPPSEVVPGVDPRFDSLVVRALDANRDTRFQSASEINDQLTSIWSNTGGGGNASVAAKSDGLASEWKKPGTSALLIGGVAILLVGVVFAVIKLTGGDGEGGDEMAELVSGGPELVLDSSRSETVDLQTPGESVPEEANEAAMEDDAEVVAQIPVDEVKAEVGRVIEPPTTNPEKEQVGGDETTLPVKGPEEIAENPVAAIQNKEMVGSASAQNAEPIGASEGIPAPEPEPSEADERIDALLTKYEGGYQRTMLSKHEQAVGDLKVQYTRALERQMDTTSKGGNLDDVIAFRSEIERVGNGAGLPESDEGLPDGLAKLRGTFRQQVKRLDGQHQEAVLTLVEPLDREFANLEAEFTKSGKVDEALVVRAVRTRIKDEGIPFVSFDTSAIHAAEQPGEEEAKRQPLGQSADSEIAKKDRKCAEWVLVAGAKVQVNVGGALLDLQSPGDISRNKIAEILPETEFTLEAVDFRAMRDLTDDDFSRFPESPSLRCLNLHETVFQESQSIRVLRGFPQLEEFDVPHANANEWVKEVTKNPNLKRLSLYRCQFSDDGARDLGELVSLISLNLTQSRISAKSIVEISKLENLEELSLAQMDQEFGEAELSQLKALKNLKVLMIHGWNVSDEAVQAFKASLPQCTIYYAGDNADQKVL